MQFVHYVVADCGDGSCRVEFYKQITKQMLQDYCDNYPNTYNGEYVQTLQFPDYFDLNSLNMHFSWLDDNDFDVD